ncbi:major facilitator superfamily permease [Streptomyces bingchenggensis BCW-1]|uniref:Major facilitator superfamily permease n=1 Tax=Streptomyces bingchenggensis (strain BCW-1) TaxID=749414 RepID=D7CC18_STRBB|nr:MULTISPECIES: major facilitator superfamily permease [Streptomyces]ADI04513.1 major facilitator superfamily permease [Streptomyces bingchenggensis BCW-1]
MLPLIGGLLVGAGVSNKLPAEAGPRAAPALGFLLVGAGLFMGTYTETSTGYGYVATWLVVIGAGLGMTMTGAMSAALNTLSKERSGVGSAVVQALRQVGGAIGVAVLGSVASSGYRGNLDLKVPQKIEDAAGCSVSTGVAVASKLKDVHMLAAVRDAFVDAMHTLLLVCSGIGVVAALLALAFMPKHAALPADAEPRGTTPTRRKTTRRPATRPPDPRPLEGPKTPRHRYSPV